MEEKGKKVLLEFEELEQVQNNCLYFQHANEMKRLKMEK
jgi:hypothetical protein